MGKRRYPEHTFKETHDEDYEEVSLDDDELEIERALSRQEWPNKRPAKPKPAKKKSRSVMDERLVDWPEVGIVRVPMNFFRETTAGDPYHGIRRYLQENRNQLWRFMVKQEFIFGRMVYEPKLD